MSDISNKEIFEFIKVLVKKYGNDAELGKEIRKIYNSEKQKHTKSK